MKGLGSMGNFFGKPWFPKLKLGFFRCPAWGAGEIYLCGLSKRSVLMACSNH